MRVSPRVSILLPAWNAAATIGAALASISRQTETAWECLVVDDGSCDGTANLVREAARDPRVHMISTPHRGLVAALNEGLQHCTAPLVARMDADDIMHRERLSAQIASLAADRGLGAVGCHVRICPRTAMSARMREYENWLNGMRSADDVARDLFVECPLAHPSLMMRREVAALGYADRGWPEDYDLLLRAQRAGYRLGVTPRRLLSWRDHGGRASRTDPRYGIARFTACKAEYLASGFLAGQTSYVLWGYGATGRLLRRALAVHGKVPSHIVEVKATRIGQRIHGAIVIPIHELPGVRGVPVIVSVARHGPRRQIRRALGEMQFLELRDFICAA